MIKKRTIFYFILPSIIVMLLVAFYPIIHGFWLSLHHIDLKHPYYGEPFIGLRNYTDILSDGRMWAALGNTVVFTFVSVGIELFLGISFAFVMHHRFKGRGIVRAAVLIPWAIPTVVSAMMWSWIYNDQFGLFNAILTQLGIIDRYITWLGTRGTAMFAIIFAEVWKTTPFMALLLLAGLQMIPEELYEASKVDGANRWTRFWHITFPLLSPILLVALLFRSMDAFRVFDLIFVLTGGGPGNTTETMSVYAYKTLFSHLRFGYGSALAIVTFVSVMIISSIYLVVIINTSRKM